MRDRFPDAIYLDLLESGLCAELLAAPERLERKVPPDFRGWVVLDEVHRLIERRRLRFALTGSSARKLRRKGVNLLAGRALLLAMHPLTSRELASDFRLLHSLRFGQLPGAYVEENPGAFLRSYVTNYLREEVAQEGLTRNLAAFHRFLEAASFSQASVLNVSAVARDCHVERKVVEDYFSILEDLLLGVRVPVFSKRARRRMVAHPKFYLFDAGVYRALRPRGPLDSTEEIDGAAFETLLFQELRAANDYLGLEYQIHYWRTTDGYEVDFVLYGERGIRALEAKRASRVRTEDFRGLEAFRKDYPTARCTMAYGGTKAYHEGAIRVLPLETCLRELPELLGAG